MTTFAAGRGALIRRKSVAPPADIAFIAQATAYVSGSSLTDHTLAYALTTASGNNRKLVAVSSSESGLISGVTYNGIALTLGVAVSDFETVDQQAAIYFIDGDDLPTDTSSHNMVWTKNVAGHMIGGILEYTNVANGTPEWTGTSITDPTPTTLTGTCTAGALIVTCASWGANTASDLTETFGETQRYFSQGTSAGMGLGVGDRVGVTAGSQSTQIIPTGTIGARLAEVACSFPRAA